MAAARYVRLGGLIFGPILLLVLFFAALHYPPLFAVIAVVMAWVIFITKAHL